MARFAVARCLALALALLVMGLLTMAAEAAAATETGLINNSDKLRVAVVINCLTKDGPNVLDTPLQREAAFVIANCR